MFFSKEIINGEPNWIDFAFGASSIVLLVLLKMQRELVAGQNWNSGWKKIVTSVSWFMGTIRAAVVVILMSVIGFVSKSLSKNNGLKIFLTYCYLTPLHFL